MSRTKPWRRISRLCGAAVWIAVLLASSVELSAATPRRVLLLHSFGPDYSPWGDMAASFRTELVKQSPGPVDLYEASVFTARFEKPEEEGPFVAYLRTLFSGRKLDLIVTMGAPAAVFAQRNRQQIFDDTPLLISGLDQRRVSDEGLTPNDAVVALTVDLPAYIRNILQLRPATQNIAMAIGNSPLERYWVGEMRRDFRQFEPRVSFTWLNELPFGEMLHRVAALPPESAVFYLLMAADANGIPQGQSHAVERLRAAAAVPVFGVGDYDLGKGIVGGPLLPSQAIGQRAAVVAGRIFRGETPSTIKTAPLGLTAPTYDWRELRKWGISESVLPAGSTILYRNPPVWERYWWQFTAIVAAFGLQSVLLVGLSFEHRRRRRAEALARRSMTELANMNRISTAGELSASIAHELKQPLSAMITNAGAGLRWLSAKTPNHIDEARAAFTSVVDDGHRAADVIDSIKAMFKKGQTDKEWLDLNELVRKVLALLKGELRAQRVVLQTNLERRLPLVRGHRGELQQVIMNLARNAADAMSKVTDRPRVLVVRSEAQASGHVHISIADSGSGIDPADVDRIFDAFFTTKSDGMGMGLAICRSIIEAHEGRLWATPNPGHGAVFHISLPVESLPVESQLVEEAAGQPPSR